VFFTAAPLHASDLTVAVMDPLAAPLSCPCVKGYAQRDYEKLGTYLEKQLGRKTHIIFAEDLAKAFKASPSHRLDLVIGKHSVVRYDAGEYHLKVRPLVMLTGKEGGTTIAGWFIVPKNDPAKTITDLKNYTILFGPADSDEKHAAAIAALTKAGIAVPVKVETRAGCSDSALDILENKTSQRMAGVISNYAAPLLEGCGSVPREALRVVGQTGDVPFIAVFATSAVNEESEKKIVAALYSVKYEPSLLTALETKNGFIGLGKQSEEKADVRQGLPQSPDGRSKRIEKCVPPAKSSTSTTDTGWPGWRGPNRDGHVARLPEKLSAEPKILWQMPLSGAALSGIAATHEVVIVADRDASDQEDIFYCLDAASGNPHWKLQYPAPGKLDYGNAPRATPLIHEGRVYLLGGFGDLHCVKLDDGGLIWKKNIFREFGAELLRWGMSASPLIVDGKLIVNPGAKKAALVALDPADGKLIWQSPGKQAAYASFIVGRFGGVQQIVGYDAISLGGWDPATGRRLWFLFPPERGDFNVPTPVDLGGKLLVATENNRARVYDFDSTGKILPKPLAHYEDLCPDCSTPVATGGRVFGCSAGLHCLDARTLKPLWTSTDDAFQDYASLVTDGERVLIASNRGELILVNAHANAYECLSRLDVFPGRSDVMAHPAVVGDRLYLRSGTQVLCLAL